MPSIDGLLARAHSEETRTALEHDSALAHLMHDAGPFANALVHVKGEPAIASLVLAQRAHGAGLFGLDMEKLGATPEQVAGINEYQGLLRAAEEARKKDTSIVPVSRAIGEFAARHPAANIESHVAALNSGQTRTTALG
jgi:hypothetical protein